MWNWVLKIFGGLFLSVCLTAAAHAQQDEIRQTIDSQLEAFKVDDFVTAFSFATPRLQMLFETPGRFQRMVTTGYPMVWRPGEVRYLELIEREGAFWQVVQITDEKGMAHWLGYLMQRTDAGWRIGAVQFLPPPDASV